MPYILFILYPNTGDTHVTLLRYVSSDDGEPLLS
jgi:hypothetical protein